MTWDYYDIKKVEIKKSNTFSMFMEVSVLLERDGRQVDAHELNISERELHGMVEDTLKQAKGTKYSTKVEDEEGEETIIEVTVEYVSENR